MAFVFLSTANASVRKDFWETVVKFGRVHFFVTAPIVRSHARAKKKILRRVILGLVNASANKDGMEQIVSVLAQCLLMV